MSYELTPNRDVELRLQSNLRQKYAESNRSGIHVSDLTLCIRQSVFRRLKPIPPNYVKLGYYVDGQRKHETLQALYGELAIKEYKGEYEGVQFHIDLLDGIPIELKTTRSNMLGKRVSKHWIRQLLFYMLAVNSKEGILQIYLINEKKDNPFPAYKVTMMNRQEVFLDFLQRKIDYRVSFDDESPNLASNVWFDKEENWACKNCEYQKDCKEIESRK